MSTTPVAETIDAFLGACDRARTATTDGQRQVARDVMINRAQSLIAIMHRLESDIEAGTAHLDANPTDQYYADNDQMVSEWHAERDEIERVLRDGLRRWLGDAALSVDHGVTCPDSPEAVAIVADYTKGRTINERMRAWNAQVSAHHARDRQKQAEKGRKGTHRTEDTNGSADALSGLLEAS